MNVVIPMDAPLDAVIAAYLAEVERVKYQRDEAWERIAALETAIGAAAGKLRGVANGGGVIRDGLQTEITAVASMLADTVITHRPTG